MVTTVAIVVLAWLVARWSPQSAYRLLEHSQQLFEPDGDVGAPRRGSGQRRPGVTVQERRVTPLMKKKVGEKFGWRCACGCGQKLSFDYHVDHIIPLWEGGSNAESNLQPLNPRCHTLKTSLENQR